MFVYAGIDEAGYGPLLGPLVVGRAVLRIPRLEAGASAPDLWARLSKAVCRSLSGRKGRIAINDSKKLMTPAAGIRHLESGCLCFARLMGYEAGRLDDWLDFLGERGHRELGHLPWYAGCEERPWDAMPVVNSAGEIAVGANVLGRTCERIGVEARELAAAVVFEDRFNEMVAATRNKASMSFTFVSRHLREVWERYGEDEPFVAVDRQGGRTSYGEPLSLAFPEAELRVVEQGAERSVYRLEHGERAMTVQFQSSAEEQHMPVALGSMVSKYTRELLMRRLNRYFAERVPQIKPTAGYAQDGQRYLSELRPHLEAMGIEEAQLCRQA